MIFEVKKLFFIAVGAVFFVILAACRIGIYQGDLRYIDQEIKRSEGKERNRWKKEKKRLIRKMILFF